MPGNGIDVCDLTPENAPDVVYQGFLAEGALAFQRCADCAKTVFPPRVLCPACGGTSLDWTRSSGTGRIYSVTTLSPRDREPYHVALIDVDDGFRMMSNIVGTDQPAIGATVRAQVERADGETRPVFTVEEAE